MSIRAVIFDLDGTLTKPFLDFEQIRSEMGISSASAGILEAMEQMPAEARLRAGEILDRHESLAAKNASLHDGVHEALDELRCRRIAVGLLTRNTRQNVHAIAVRHRLSFDAVIDRQDGPVKPHGFGVLKLCSMFGASPRQTLVVGDFLHDLQAARHAGAIAVLMRTHPKAAEFEDQADYVIDTLSELIQIIEQLERNQV